MKILDMFIEGLVDDFIKLDNENIMSRDEWRNICSSAVERNITKDEFIKELTDIFIERSK